MAYVVALEAVVGVDVSIAVCVNAHVGVGIDARAGDGAHRCRDFFLFCWATSLPY